MRHSLLLTLFLLVSFFAFAQPHAIPMDPHVRYGRLDNGLTFYIRHNDLPSHRAHFYIVQNVGAILEQDSQNGLAHFLEHMAFNGTRNFPDKGIIDYMQSIGAKFGANLNAYTSLDETVYTLKNIPVPRPSVVDSALLILHDQSSFILLLDHEIDKERGVIREEWRQGATANRRLWAKGNKLKYPGSQYAKRDVIGDTAVINNFPYDTLRAYYRKWYRPDLQAIVVVGDVNADSVEQSLRRIFADIPAPVNPAERVFYQVPDNQNPIVSVVTDPEAKNTTLGLEFKKKPLERSVKASEEGYLHVLTDQLISLMFAERLSVLSSRPQAPFVDSYVYYGNVIRPCDAFLVGVVPKEHMERQAWQALVSELERLRRFGFLPSEWERARKRLIASLEKSFNERDKQGRPENDYYGNLRAKRALIEEIEAYVSAGAEADLEAARGFAERWNAIGFVPFKEKEAVQDAYRSAMQAKVPDFNRGGRREGGRGPVRGEQRRSNAPLTEKDKLTLKYNQLQQDIQTYENNIGFFGLSKGAEQLKAQMQQRIDAAKADLKELEAKIRELVTKEQEEEQSE